MKKYFTIFLIFFIFPFFIFAQETEVITDEADDLDSLFDEPVEDIITEEEILPEVDHREVFEKSETITVKGSFRTTGVAAVGWAGWNFIPDLSQDFDPSAGITSKASISFDARPFPEFRVFGSVSTSFNPLDGDADSLDELTDTYSSFLNTTITDSWDGISIGSLYCDYILNDFLYTRIGKHSFKWGQGRLYTPGNLMADSGNTYNIRMSMPTLSGLTFVVLTNGATTYKKAVYAGKADFVFGNVMLSPALRFNWDEGFNALLSYKQVIFGTDVFADVTANFGHEFESANAVAGFYKEWEDFILYGEYMATLYSDGRITHNGGLALGLDNPFGAPFDLGAQVKHNFMDLSGTITLGLTQKIFPFVNMKIGVPIVYGSRDSSSVVNNSDPSKRRISLVLALELKGGF